MSNVCSAIVGVTDQDYRYKSVGTQIPYDTGLAPVHPAGNRTWDIKIKIGGY